jgi:hypothetical protein
MAEFFLTAVVAAVSSRRRRRLRCHRHHTRCRRCWVHRHIDASTNLPIQPGRRALVSEVGYDLLLVLQWFHYLPGHIPVCSRRLTCMMYAINIGINIFQ